MLHYSSRLPLAMFTADQTAFEGGPHTDQYPTSDLSSAEDVVTRIQRVLRSASNQAFTAANCIVNIDAEANW